MRNAHGQLIRTSIPLESLYSGMLRIDEGLSGMTELWVLPGDRRRIAYRNGAIDLVASRGIRFACRSGDAPFWLMCC
ncbi:MAG: hypothetical protein D6685_17440 [Bacteroidetes bacterium]|nr:hypothetical protein AWN76_006345 [Rhodothermaceae bacterium RA]RMH51402.1 MAG: hypothetical protein D6685_17440 [Bacteroidota bacterium]